VDYFISTKFGGDNTYQSMTVKTSIQNNSTHVIRFRIKVNGRIAETVTIKIVVWIILFISTKIGGDNKYQSMNVKTSIKNNSTHVIGHNYVGNQPILYWSKRMDRQ